MARRGESLAGAARLELVSGVVHLRPEDAVFEAMLRGWRAQQVARGLREDTIDPRERLVCVSRLTMAVIDWRPQRDKDGEEQKTWK